MHSQEIQKAFEKRYQAIFTESPHKQRTAFEQAIASTGIAMPSTLLKPVILSASEQEYLASLAVCLGKALSKVMHHFLGGPKNTLRAFAPMSEQALDLAYLDPGYVGLHVLTRFDVFYERDTGRVQFLECNAGDPSGMGYVDLFAQAFLEAPAFQKAADAFGLSHASLTASLQAVLLKKYEEFCQTHLLSIKKNPSIALAVARESTVLEDHKAMQAAFLSKGLQARLVDPRDFEEAAAGLKAAGIPVDLVFRDTIDELLLPPYQEKAKKLLKAYRNGSVCMVNPCSSVLADFKGLFEVFSSASWEDLYTSEEKEVLHACVPWTRVVRTGKTLVDGLFVDLPEYLLASRETLVLKPNEGYGGFGVLIGRETSAEDWKATLQKALASPASYIAQRYTKAPCENFPVFQQSQFAGFQPKNVTLSLWLHDGEYAGAFARASDESVINVHQGGGLMPVFIASSSEPTMGSSTYMSCTES